MSQQEENGKDQAGIYVLYWKNCNWEVHDQRKLPLDLQREEMISEWKASELDSYFNNLCYYFWDSEYVTIWKKNEIDEKGLDTKPLTVEERKKIWLWALENMSEDGLVLWKENRKDGGFRMGADNSIEEFSKAFYEQQKEELGKDLEDELDC